MAQYNYDPDSLGKDFASYNAFGDVNHATSDGNIVSNSSPYSYKPAKENLTDVMKGIATLAPEQYGNLGKTFKSMAFNPNWTGSGDDSISALIAQMVSQNPEALQSLGLTADDLKLVSPEGYQGDSWNPAQWRVSDAARKALAGTTWNRTGLAGIKDGRSGVIRDASGNILNATKGYSYDPAGDLKDAALRAVAVMAAAYGGGQLLGAAGAGTGAGGTAASAGSGWLDTAVASDLAASQAAAIGQMGAGAGLTAGELAAIVGGGGVPLAGGMVNGAFLGEGIASGIPAWDAAATKAGLTLTGGGSTVGSVLSNVVGNSNTIKDIVKGAGKALTGGGGGGGGGNPQAGNFDITKFLSSLAGIYAGNRQQEQAKDFYDKLSSQFGPDSAYAKQLRQELERRDSASGRRSQYGPREVELQAKLADQASKNLTTMTALMDKQNAGLTQQLQAGLTGGQVSGLNDIFGNAIKNIGSDIWKDFKNTDFYKDLFDFDWFGD